MQERDEAVNEKMEEVYQERQLRQRPMQQAPQQTSNPGSTRLMSFGQRTGNTLEFQRNFSIVRCVQLLVHTCQCEDADCPLANCQRMKRVVAHVRNCKRRTNGDCPICKQLFALCCHHARLCQVQDNKCSVPFCFNIRQKLKQQQRMQLSSAAKSCKQQQQQQSQPGMSGIHGELELPQLPGGISGPSTQVGQQVLQKLMQTLTSPNTPEQQIQIHDILKSNPPLMAAIIKMRQARTLQQQTVQRSAGGAITMTPSQSQQQQQQRQYKQKKKGSKKTGRTFVLRTSKAVKFQRKFLLQRGIKNVVHANQCEDANCRLASCQSMNRAIAHIKNSKKRAEGVSRKPDQLIYKLQGKNCSVSFHFEV